MNTSNEVKRDLTPDQLQQMYAISDEATYSDAKVKAVRDPITRRILRSEDGGDDQLNVLFSTEPVFSRLETYLNGTPTYVDQEFVTISVPGLGASMVVHQPVSEYYKWRFPLEYENFKRGQAELITGTPLHIWNYLSPSQIKHMEHQGIRTVEQIANLSDGAGAQFHGFYALKARAQQFLNAARDSSKANQLQEELAKRDVELDALKEQMSRLASMLEAQNAEKKTKTPPKGADQ